eukprot:CAMPEP_0180645742 /NCGR_PEP_ID=MMETSP1037_2-20121125/49171_1 /TAXON_ID=632150 /ORGANISM="Azadinium spinosum, Strain 3D9" /LENGTH=95 /DNA_ID=CAMNT_0022669659 /DNA_START=404 /DNA_END=688 /DNA_ORIENTATION=+
MRPPLNSDFANFLEIHRPLLGPILWRDMDGASSLNLLDAMVHADAERRNTSMRCGQHFMELASPPIDEGNVIKNALFPPTKFVILNTSHAPPVGW